MRKLEFIEFPNGELELKEGEEKKLQIGDKDYFFEFNTEENINIQIIKFYIFINRLNFIRKDISIYEHVWVYTNYLPYGRADKKGFENNAMLARDVYNSKGVVIIPLAMHSEPLPFGKNGGITQNEEPKFTSKILRKWVKENKGNDNDCLIIFPDEGAWKRFSPIIDGDYNKKFGKPFETFLNLAHLEKERDANTGQLKFKEEVILKTGDLNFKEIKKVLVIDDILSKGGTFLAANEIIKSNFPDAKIKFGVFYDENTMSDENRKLINIEKIGFKPKWIYDEKGEKYGK